MTQLFAQLRNYGYGECIRFCVVQASYAVLTASIATILVLSATVLGIAAYLGSIFLPDLRRECS